MAGLLCACACIIDICCYICAIYYWYMPRIGFAWGYCAAANCYCFA